MTFTDKLLLAIISGLLLWVIKDFTTYLIRRSRIQAALLTEVSFLVGAVRETKRFLEESFQRMAPIGKEVQYSASFSEEARDIYKEYAPSLTSYLGKRSLIRVIKFHRAVQEFEILCGGYFSDLTEWKKQNHVLTDADVNYLERKKARIVSIANIITEKEVRNLLDLPEDYKGELDPGSIVR